MQCIKRRRIFDVARKNRSRNVREQCEVPQPERTGSNEREWGLRERQLQQSTGNGRVVHDSRGNAVWQWGVATGVFARIQSNELLNMLEDPTLALEGEAAEATAGEWAGDPYNRR